MDADLFEVIEVYDAHDLWIRRYKLERESHRSESSPRPASAGKSPPLFSRSVAASMRIDESLDAFEVQIERSAPPPWSIGFSKQFKKDTDGLDRKLLGRVLEALEEISGYSIPLHAHGDTFKALSGPLEGCWRYRIGDHRLVVKPQIPLAQIDALTLGARGSVYD